MEERTFRILLLVVAGLVLLNVGAMAWELFEQDIAGERSWPRIIGQLCGYALLLLAAAGFWIWQPWAFWALGIATVAVLAFSLGDGAFSAFWRMIPHLTLILLVIEQYFTRKQEQEDARQAEEEQARLMKR